MISMAATGFSPSAGLVDGMTGLLDATVDGMHPDVHVSVVKLLEQTVERKDR